MSKDEAMYDNELTLLLQSVETDQSETSGQRANILDEVLEDYDRQLSSHVDSAEFALDLETDAAPAPAPTQRRDVLRVVAAACVVAVLVFVGLRGEGDSGLVETVDRSTLPETTITVSEPTVAELLGPLPEGVVVYAEADDSVSLAWGEDVDNPQSLLTLVRLDDDQLAAQINVLIDDGTMVGFRGTSRVGEEVFPRWEISIVPGTETTPCDLADACLRLGERLELWQGVKNYVTEITTESGRRYAWLDQSDETQAPLVGLGSAIFESADLP